MEKTIKIGNKEIRLSNNVGWTIEYRDQFGKDIVPALMPMLATFIETMATIMGENAEISMADIITSLEGRAVDVLLPMFQAEFVDLGINVVWAMAKAADEDIEPPKKWVKQFDSFPLDTIIPTVYELVFKGFVSSKNQKRLKMLGKELKNLQPLTSTQLSSQDSKED